MSRNSADGTPSDRLSRLSSHILCQRSFYPLYPPAEAVPLDFSLARDPPKAYYTGGDSGSDTSGRIMLSALVVLFFAVVLVFSLHLYARWFLFRARRRHLLARRNAVARTHAVFVADHGNNPANTVARGLEARVLQSLPVFKFPSKTDPDSVLECAVCLSEFEENESGRILPKCNHSFHTECIDMWFYSHSTCPLCRTPVEEYNPTPANPGDVALTIPEPTGVDSGPASGPGLCATCRHENEQIGTSSGGRMKLSVEVPRRNGEGFEGESSACESATSQSSYRSPMSGMLSFKRILSRERRQSPCASPRTVTVIESESPV